MDFRNKKVSIVTHRDGDGISSAAIFSIMLKKLGNFPVSISSPEHVGFDSAVKETIKTHKPDIIVSLDVPVTSVEYLGIPTLVIDHHPYKELNKNFEMVHDLKHCTAYLAYLYCSKIVDMRGASWVAALGCLSDKDDAGFEEIEKIYKETYPELTKEQLHSMASYISSSKIVGEHGVNCGINALIEADSMSMPTTIFGSTPNAQKLINLRELSRRERDYWLLSHKDFVKMDGIILFYPIKSRFQIESYLAGTLANLYPNHVCVVVNYFEKKKDVVMEGRTKLGKVNIGKIFHEICKKIGGDGGGLKGAAGAIISKEKEKEFLEELKQLV